MAAEYTYGEQRHAVSVWLLVGGFFFLVVYRGVMGAKAADGVFQTSPCLVLRPDWKSQRTPKKLAGRPQKSRSFLSSTAASFQPFMS
jgi:hypothetical protein